MSHAAVLPSLQSSRLIQTVVLGTCHFSLFICLRCLARAGSGQAAFWGLEMHQAGFLQPLQSGWRLFACQAGPLNSFVKVQLRDHSPVPGSLVAWPLARERLRAEGVRVCLAAEGGSRRARGCLSLAAGPGLLLASRQGFWPPSSLAELALGLCELGIL